MTQHKYKTKREGIGSLFHAIKPSARFLHKIDFEFEYELFYTGRQAFKYILDTISENHVINKIWIPSYYCQHVTRWVKKVYPNVFFYDISPFTFNNKLNVNDFAEKDDVVLINNYWGLSDSMTKTSKYPIIVEDHSHGWLTKNCMNSKADYCFTSLRKSLPIPLGGMAWKPGTSLGNETHRYITDNDFYQTFDKLHGAMKTKTQYKNGAQDIDKKNYLKVIDETEDFLDVNHDIVKLRPQDLNLLNHYININFLSYKQKNLKTVYKQLIPVDFMKVVKRPHHTSFGLILLFKNQMLWNDLRTYLITNEIYPSFLWPDNSLNEEWQYVLNIHVDFRYDEQDMIFIAETLNNWIKSQSNT